MSATVEQSRALAETVHGLRQDGMDPVAVYDWVVAVDAGKADPNKPPQVTDANRLLPSRPTPKFAAASVSPQWTLVPVSWTGTSTYPPPGVWRLDEMGGTVADDGVLETVQEGDTSDESQAEALPADRTKVWNTQGDEYVRLAHADAEGQAVPVDEPFEVGGEQCMYPGDPDLSPELRINCRCYLTSGDGLSPAEAGAQPGGGPDDVGQLVADQGGTVPGEGSLDAGQSSISTLANADEVSEAPARGEAWNGDPAHGSSYQDWASFEGAERTRAAADEMLGLEHYSADRVTDDSIWQPKSADEARAEFMLDQINGADGAQVNQDTNFAAGRWGGWTADYEQVPGTGPGTGQPYQTRLLDPVPTDLVRGMAIADDEMPAFIESLRGGQINFGLASFTAGEESAFGATGYNAQAGFTDVQLRLVGNPRVLQGYSTQELITDGLFQVLSEGYEGKSYVVTIRQIATYGSDGSVHPL